MATTENTAVSDIPELAQGLTAEEDDELRRLHYFNQVGRLSGGKLERFLELRLRDRRATIRPPREFAQIEQNEAQENAGRRRLAWRIRR